METNLQSSDDACWYRRDSKVSMYTCGDVEVEKSKVLIFVRIATRVSGESGSGSETRARVCLRERNDK